MFTIIAPTATDFATAIQHYRKKYDPLAEVIPPHITVVKPFLYTGSLPELYTHLDEIGDIYAPIKVSLAGWDIYDWDVEGQTNYQLRLPTIAGRQELAALRGMLLDGPLSYLNRQAEEYWPHVVFGRFSNDSDAQKAKKDLKEFEAQFVFRVTHVELLSRDNPIHPWQVQKSFSLKATVAGAGRQNKMNREGIQT